VANLRKCIKNKRFSSELLQQANAYSQKVEFAKNFLAKRQIFNYASLRESIFLAENR
tara:strand:- start:1411 stop:1581 length:171 start_codon:yes stop_codon:yes gene_type:complete